MKEIVTFTVPIRPARELITVINHKISRHRRRMDAWRVIGLFEGANSVEIQYEVG